MQMLEKINLSMLGSLSFSFRILAVWIQISLFRKSQIGGFFHKIWPGRKNT